MDNAANTKNLWKQFHSEYLAWSNMKARCENPKLPNYPRYGGRGIKVCQEWKTSFLTFLTDMKPKPTPQHTLDRIDNNGDYHPENCRWATVSEQQANRRINVRITHDGRTQCASEWEKELGLPQGTINRRFKKGLPTEKLFAPPKTYRNREKIDLIELCARHQIPYQTLYARLFTRGWSLEKSLHTPVKRRETNQNSGGIT